MLIGYHGVVGSAPTSAFWTAKASHPNTDSMPCPRQTWGVRLLITKMKNVSISGQQVKRTSLLALGNLPEKNKRRAFMAEIERGADQEQTKKGCLDLCRPAAVLEHLKGAKFVL